MADEQQVEQANDEAEEIENESDQDDEDVEPDYLDPLEEFVAEAETDRERIKATAESVKQTLEQHKAQLSELQGRVAAETTEGQLLAAQIASLDSQLLMLDEQSETFTLFLADLARLTFQNVNQLRNNDDELADAIDGGMGEGAEGAIVTDSILMPQDGNLFAGLLYEYMQQLQAAIPQTGEGSNERAVAQGRINQLAHVIARVQEITVQMPSGPQPDLPQSPPEAGAQQSAEPQPAAQPAPPAAEQQQPQT